MSSLVNKKFAEWTYGLDTRQSIISIFEHIRDIPYSLDVPWYEGEKASERLLIAGKGSCGPKHHLLAEMYRKLDLNVMYATFAFSWNNPDIRYPPNLREIVSHLPVSHHLACRVRIGCRWVLVDATWDPPLAKVGFPVNGHWDGYADMQCAVKPIPSPVRTAFCRTATNEPCRSREEVSLCPLDGERDYGDANDRSRDASEKRLLLTPDQITLSRLFSTEFSRWLEQVRLSDSKNPGF